MFTQTPISIKKSVLGIAALVLSASLFGQQANAKEFKITASSSHPPVVPWISVLKNYVVPEARKRAQALGHSIKWTEAYAGALYNFKNTLEGIEDGLGDIGWVGTLWEPNKLPLHNVTFYLPFVSGNVSAGAEIAREMHTSIPAFKKALLKHNQVFLGAQAIDDYILVSTMPIKSVADLKGKKFYAPGASAQWLKGTGAVAVNGGLPVYYNGIKTGVADGAIVPGSGIFPFKLHEAAPYVTNVGLGGGITGALTMNKTKFDSLPPEMQKMFLEVGKGYEDRVAKKTAGFAAKSMKTLIPGKGGKVSTLSLAEQKKWASVLPDLAGIWAAQMAKKGLPGKSVIKFYMDGVRKRGEKPLRNWDK
jgi:TRAP-type C4-dicarboxylate transport system substrate-binding protein